MSAHIDGAARRRRSRDAAASSPGALSALRAVLPQGTRVLAVGGVSVAELETWWTAGARGFGVGGALYRPGRSLQEVRKRAAELVDTARGLEETARAS